MISNLLSKIGLRKVEAEPAPEVRQCAACDIRVKAMQSLDFKLGCATGAQRSMSRRLHAFAKAHPELHQLYFTKAGDAARGVEVTKA